MAVPMPMRMAVPMIMEMAVPMEMIVRMSVNRIVPLPDHVTIRMCCHEMTRFLQNFLQNNI